MDRRIHEQKADLRACQSIVQERQQKLPRSTSRINSPWRARQCTNNVEKKKVAQSSLLFRFIRCQSHRATQCFWMALATAVIFNLTEGLPAMQFGEINVLCLFVCQWIIKELLYYPSLTSLRTPFIFCLDIKNCNYILHIDTQS